MGSGRAITSPSASTLTYRAEMGVSPGRRTILGDKTLTQILEPPA